MAEVVQNPPSLSRRLMKQWRWIAVAIVVVALAIISKNADIKVGSSATTTGCRVEVTADVLNVRVGPDPQTASVEQLNRGKVVDAQKETSNGFRKLGDNRWVATEFVKPSGDCG